MFLKSVKTLRPVIFKDRERDLGTSFDGFCILLGEDPQVGIMGCGMCLEEAIDDWRKSLRERILNAKDDDELANFVKDSLEIQKIDNW